MSILVTGGAGYVGSLLTKKLQDLGYQVTVLDALWFGNYLAPHKNLTLWEKDVRDAENLSLKGFEQVIALANVANDPCVELEPKLSWEVNALATMQLCDRAVRDGVKQFIFASSGSVYGVKEEPQVTEELTLKPISEYNKTKMVAERVVMSYEKDMIVQCIRPATVCGLSPRMRLDLSVNMLTMQALSKGEITVLGGNQTRPNIHIEDLVDVYIHFLGKGREFTGIYNAGFENMSIMEIAELASKTASAKIVVKDSNDPRSYRLSSQKLLNTGFKPKKKVADAIQELAGAYKAGKIQDLEQYYNVKWMKKHQVR